MVDVLVTGGAGFHRSEFCPLAHDAHPDWRITTLDKLTYAGRLENLESVKSSPRHRFVKGDIADATVAAPLVRASEIVVHFAAETHVDRSILAAGDFIHTDVFGTFVLLEAAREATALRRFIQISTDEVYGSVPEGKSRETDELRPRNPYAASKAGADRLAYSYWATYGVPVIVTRASNNYGAQPVSREGHSAVHDERDRQPVRAAVRRRAERARLAPRRRSLPRPRFSDRARTTRRATYNIGGGNEIPNIELTRRILDLVGRPVSLIEPVTDRPGHDRRYALDTGKLERLGWRPQMAFDAGLAATVEWYRRNESWWRPIKDQDQAFRAYYVAQYGGRRSPA